MKVGEFCDLFDGAWSSLPLRFFFDGEEVWFDGGPEAKDFAADGPPDRYELYFSTAPRINHLGSDETGAKPAAPAAVPSDSSQSREARHGVVQALVDKVRVALNADPAISGDAQRAHDEGFKAVDALLRLIDELADRLYQSAATADRRQGTIDKLTRERDAAYPLIAALAVYGEDVDISALVAKARELNQAAAA